MTELEKLIEQRDELNRQIKALQSPKYEVDGARMCTKHGDSWVVTVQEIDTGSLNKDKTWAYKQLVRAKTREECIEYLGHIVDALTQLYSKVRQG